MPADADWNAPARTKAIEPRFPQLYAPDPSGGHNRYEELSREYETALRKVLSAHQRINEEVINTLDALFEYYEQHFQANAFKLFASSRSPLSAAEQFRRLTDRNSDATLDERIEAFADAVFANPDYPEALDKLWARKPELKPDGLSGVPEAAIPYSAETRQQAQEYGYRFAEAPAETVTHLMRVRRVLRVPGGHSMFFRDALIGWGLKSHSLAEVLAATQKAGIRGGAEPSRPVDAARLYAWSDAQLDPRRAVHAAIPGALRQSYGPGSSVWDSLRQPHERWFQEALQSFDAFTRENLDRIATMAGLEGAPAPAVPAGTSTPRRRRALMELWERQGVTTGVKNLQAGHLLGLYLALGPDRHLLPVRPAHSAVFSQGETSPPLPDPTARRLVLRAWEGKDDYPALFVADTSFSKQLARAERARNDGPSEKELRVLRDQLIKLAVERTELLAPVLSGYEELASEAAERLIPAHRRAWFGEWAAGPVDGPHTFGNDEGVIRRGPRHIVSVDRRSLLDGLVASDDDREGGHLVLYEVLKSTAREVAPFLPTVDHTARGTALYPGKMVFRYQGYRIERDERHQLSYVVVTLKEAPKPLSPDMWDREFQSQTMRGRNGTQIGSALMGSNDWVTRKGGVIRRTEAGSYRTYDDSYIFSDQEHPVPWQPGQVGWLNVHGSGKDFLTPSRYGAKRVSGAQVGAYARQLLRSLGLPDIPIVYVACSTARSHAVGTVAAQVVADWSKQVGFAGPTTIAYPVGGAALKNKSGQPITPGFMALQTTADDPAPRFTRFEPRPLTDAVGPEPIAQRGAWAEGLYALEEWRELARGYEVALAKKLAGDPEALDAARHAVEAAGGTRPTSTDITEVMLDFFARALPQMRLRDFDVKTVPLSTYHGEYRARGVRITREGHALPELLFEEYAELAAPSYPQSLAFRKAVVAWLVGSTMPYAHSLHEVVRASTGAHVGFDDMADTIALAGDAAHLYMWADQHLGPDGGTTPVGLALPME
ncbi:hypothetical protein, partial [Streptomyces sp. NPDC093109]|uniref:hypothetical protein n=1 Tax=Streptomyces sp. NPDC093109 TaxID=3154977 RepID=UPI00344BD9A0